MCECPGGSLKIGKACRANLINKEGIGIEENDGVMDL